MLSLKVETVYANAGSFLETYNIELAAKIAPTFLMSKCVIHYDKSLIYLVLEVFVDYVKKCFHWNLISWISYPICKSVKISDKIILRYM